MSDLIRREDVRSMLCMLDNEGESIIAAIVGLSDIPTAYDVDKVVEQVKEIGSRFCIFTHCNGICGECDHGVIMKAIISKIEAGGIDE